MRIGISIGVTQVAKGSRRALTPIFPVELLHDGSGNFTIVPGSYSNPESLAITATYTLYKNAVETAFSPVLGADGRLTFTDTSTDTQFYVRERATAPGAGATTAVSNSIYVAAAPVDTLIAPEQWTFGEALADADTRKAYLTCAGSPAATKKLRWYWGTVAAGDSAFLTDFSGSAGAYTATSVGQASVSSPNEYGQTRYARIAECSAGNAFEKWASESKEYKHSGVPGVPTVSATTGAGQGEILVDITNGAATNGRALIRYEYSLDGGSWFTLAGGTAVGSHVISGTTPVTAYGVRIRAVNTNGNGNPTASQTATSGAVAAVPAQMIADTDWTLVDKPSTGGDRLILTVINLPSDGGSALTDIEYTINGGTPISFGLTPGSVEITSDTPELPTNVVVYAQNAVGDAPGSSLTKTPTKTTAASTTAYFGAATPSSTGGWKPTTALGDEVDLVSIVSQTGMTRTWSISSGALVANGTPDVDNGKTLTVSTADGNIVVAIATIADAKSCGTSLELNTALGTSSSVPYQLLMRGGRSYDMLGPTDTSTSSIFANRNFASTARRTVTTHPNDIQKWISTCWKHNFSGTVANLTIAKCRSGDGPNARNQGKLWCYTSGTIDGLWFEDMDVWGPDIPIETLNDPNPWPTTSVGYTGPAPWAFSFAPGSLTAIKNMQFRRIDIRRVYTAGDFCTGGAFRLEDVLVDTWYFDGIRLNATSDTVAKLIKNIKVCNCFAKYNEMRDVNGAVQQSPHSDAMQLIGSSFGTLQNCVIMNFEQYYGPYRGDLVSGPLMGNGTAIRCVWHNMIGHHKTTSTGLGTEQSRYVVVSNSSIIGENNDTGWFRAGSDSGNANSTYYSMGEHVLQNSVARFASGTTNAWQVNNRSRATSDPGYLTPINLGGHGAPNYGNVLLGDFFKGLNGDGTGFGNPGSWANLRLMYRAKTGETRGPLDESGNWRTEVYPPMHGGAPQLFDSGADVLIVPAASLLCAETPGSWDYQYRNASGAVWTQVNGLTGASATLVAPTKAGLEVMCRYRSAGGLIGPWGPSQTTISGTTAITNSAVPTLSRAGTTVTVTPGTYSVVPDSYTRTQTVNGVTTSLAGTTFTVAPGDSYYITETPVKVGYTGSPVNSPTGSYPILTATADPVIQISGTTVSLVSGPTWSDTPDSVTITKVVAGTETSWDGSSSITLTSGQSCYVKYLPVKASYYVAQATQSNTVSASASSYPTLKNVAANNGGGTNTSGPVTLAAYASRASGDTLFVLLVVDENPTVTPSSGWTLIRSDLGAGGTGTQTALLYSRTADGTSTDDLVVSFSSSQNYVARKWCFDGAVSIATTAPHNSSGTQTPNGPNLDLGSSKAAYWIVATAYQGGTGSISSANVVSSYTWIGNNLSADNGPGVGLAACYKTATAQAENPAGWGQTISNPITYTIGVYI